MYHRVKLWLRSLPWFYRLYTTNRNRLQALRYGLRDVPASTYVHSRCHLSRDLRLGEYTSIGPECRIGPRVIIGRYVLIAPRVAIVGADHNYDQPGVPIVFSGRPELPTTTLEDDVWVGYGAVILAGRRIGRGAIIAAGAVVTKDVAPYEIWGGVPACRLALRFLSSDACATHDRMLSESARPGTYPEYRF